MNGARRRAVLGAGAWAAWPAWAAPCPPWPAWQAFSARFIGDGGRVAEAEAPRQRTVSEAQGYALFFALVANQRTLFERLLRWTEDALAGGDLTQRLPSWHWGRRDDGNWGVIDNNAASDADLWIAYALTQAGRLWRVRRYTALGTLLAERVLREETAELPGMGLSLLPGPRGFTPAPERWRLNPSYLPLMQLRWFAVHLGGRWRELLQASVQLLHDSAPRGLAPDWAVFEAGKRRWLHEEGAGSYDAIRVYLWLGLTAVQDPSRAELLAHFAPMAAATEAGGVPPERVDAVAGTWAGAGPVGFSAALLPFLQAMGRDAALRQQLQRLREQPPAGGAYYDQVLTLFGQGAHEGRFRFDADGSLLPAWSACAPRAAPSR